MSEWMFASQPTVGSGFSDLVFTFSCGDVRVQSNSLDILHELEDAPRHWETALRIPKRGELTFTLRLRQAGEIVPLPPQSTLLYHNFLYPGVPLEYFQSDGLRIFRVCGADVVALDYERSLAFGATSACNPLWSQQYLYNCVFFPPVLEWMGWHDVFVFHGGIVALDEDGVLIMGPSGSGKTTTVLALALAGFSFLTDDIGLLLVNEDLKVTGLSEPINVCPDTPRLFSEFCQWAPALQGTSKQTLPLNNMGGIQTRQWSYPRLLLFPEVHPDSDVALIPLARGEALDLLLPNGMFLTGMKEGKRRLLAFLQLLETTRPMRLILGKELRRLPKLVKETMSSLKDSHGHRR